MAKKPEKMKRIKLVHLSALLLAGGLIANHAQAQTFTCATGIAFGDYTPCSSTQTATITPNNTRSTTGCLVAGPAPYNRAICSFTNQPTIPYPQLIFSVTATKYTIKNAASVKMNVDNFKCRFQVAGSSSTTKTGACNLTTSPLYVTMGIGADLHVGGSQAAGSYSGKFTVTTNIP